MIKGDYAEGKEAVDRQTGTDIQGLAMTLVKLLQVKAFMKQCIRALRAERYCNKIVHEENRF